MLTEEFGRDRDKTVVLLHGAHIVHCFRSQYVLADRYHLIVPHLMGFGREADRIFDADTCLEELTELLTGLHRKVLLVGFSLGAQLAFRLASLRPELFTGVILVSPWLIKDDAELARIEQINLRQLRSLQRPWACRMTAALNGVPRPERREFVRQLTAERPETVHSVVYNGITLAGTPEFSRIDIPVLALAGQQEPAVMQDSVKALEKANPRCRCELWEKAGHNIPTRFPERFNQCIADLWNMV